MEFEAQVLHALPRQNFNAFVEKAFATLAPGQAFVPRWHLRAIAWQLERIRRGEIKRLIINLPPRSLKSIMSSVEISGFAPAGIDHILLGEEADGLETGPLEPPAGATPVSRLGDVFLLGPHRIVCDDARDPEIVRRLMGDDAPAQLLLTDEPYNVPIAGNVSRGGHREFAMASGEMSEAEYLTFNQAWMRAFLPVLVDGAILATFIDWRGYPVVHAAAIHLGLTALNLVVWSKTNAGMGSLYRSQHELLPMFKKGCAPHINNVELGRKGCWRSNVWIYPGASSLGSDSRPGLQDHPTVKPTAMLRDAIIDLTRRGDHVLDPFLGSGSTLIAAEQTGRVCFGVEFDPLYIDIIVRRYEAASGELSILVETGETFGELAGRREEERRAAEDRAGENREIGDGETLDAAAHGYRARLRSIIP